MNILSERENKFLQMIYDHVTGDVSQIVTDIYRLAEKNGFYHPEVTSITLMLRGLGYLEKRGYIGVIDEKPAGLMIACVRLTSKGALYIRSLSETVIQDLSGGNEKNVDLSAIDGGKTAVPQVSTHTVSWIPESKWTKAGVVIAVASIVIAIILFLLQYYKVFG